MSKTAWQSIAIGLLALHAILLYQKWYFSPAADVRDNPIF